VSVVVDHRTAVVLPVVGQRMAVAVAWAAWSIVAVVAAGRTTIVEVAVVAAVVVGRTEIVVAVVAAGRTPIVEVAVVAVVARMMIAGVAAAAKRMVAAAAVAVVVGIPKVVGKVRSCHPRIVAAAAAAAKRACQRC
jgi:hypothetical protein